MATGLSAVEGSQPVLAGCDGLDNCVSSTANNAENLVDPISYDGDVSEVIGKIATLVAAQEGTEIAVQSPTYLHAIFKTKLMGYTDDLEVLVDEITGTLNIRSASRIGKSDLGANRKRVNALRELLSGKL